MYIPRRRSPWKTPNLKLVGPPTLRVVLELRCNMLSKHRRTPVRHLTELVMLQEKKLETSLASKLRLALIHIKCKFFFARTSDSTNYLIGSFNCLVLPEALRFLLVG